MIRSLMGRVALVCLSLACVADTGAHQSPVVAVAPSEIGDAPPPMPGSARFFTQALPLLRPRCDHAAAERLDRIERLVRDANAVRWGAIPGVDPRAAENLRAMAEVELLELLGGLRADIEFDLATAKPGLTTASIDPLHNTLLVRVADGDGSPDVRLQDWDLTTEDFDRDTHLLVRGGGVTHSVVRLAGVPEDETTIRFAIRRQNEPAPVLGQALRLTAPLLGRLALSLRDEDDRPTHALVAIRPAGGGVCREISDAVDLRGQLNDVVSTTWIDVPGRDYLFQLPGLRRGRYWVTPAETDLTLPAGDWELRVLRGIEQTPEKRVISVSAGEVARATVRVRRWIDQPSRGWWSGDDHVHARLMSGSDANRLLDYAEAVDLHVANILKMGDPLRTYYSQRGFGRDYRARRGMRWLVPGQEDPRSDLGHVIGLNLERQVRDVDRYLQNDALAAEMHAMGGLYGHTHVSDGACFAHRQMALFTPREIVDFTSIMQSALGVGLYYDFLNLGFRLTATAGADTPYAGTMGTVRVYAFTGKPTLDDPDEWFDAIEAGRTFVTNGPMLEFSVNGVGPGGVIDAAEATELSVTARALGDPGWSAPKRLAIVRLGEEILVATSDDPQRGELEVRTTVDAGEGCWIAATAVGHDGSQAHTTPVYVTGEDGWHGGRRSAPAIAEKQLKVLEEIEVQVLQDAERKIDSGKRHPLDLQPLTNASQADAVRERIATAAEFYRDVIERFREDE